MTKYIEWTEPYDIDCKVCLICRVKVDELIPYEKERVLKTHEYKYDNDEDVLMDFIAVHWAKIIEVDEE